MGIYTCQDCGNTFRSARRKANGCCATCSMQHIIASIRQMRDKHGPYYDKWKQHHDRTMALLRKEDV